MNFDALADEVIALRFNEAERANVKSWINLCYSRLWDYADWNFKTTSGVLTIGAGDNTPTMPADFGKAISLHDSLGRKIVYLSPQEWDEMFLLNPGATSTPSYYKVINRQIYLGSTPAVAGTMQLAYKRRISHVDSVSGIVGGVFVEDSDLPLWPTEHDYVLVLETVLLGQRIEGDPTEPFLMRARDEALQAMINDLVGEVVPGEYQFVGPSWP